MLLIQKLIDEKMSEGKSRAQIAREAKVTKTAIHNYYHNLAKPEGKSLVALATYFNRPFYELMEEVGENMKKNDSQDDALTRLLFERLRPLPEKVKLKVLQMVVEMTEAPKQSDDRET